MKPTIRRATILAMAIAGLAATTGVASAQASIGDLTANVPFAFHSGPKLMEAGRYVIKANSPSTSIVTIRSAQKAGHAMMGIATQKTASAGARRTKGKLLFHKYGEAWFLREVEVPGSPVAYVMPKSSREREYARGNSGRLGEVAIVEFGAAASTAAE